ncbi:MAG: fibronectin type III domain-containing protein [Eubacterium sp.]
MKKVLSVLMSMIMVFCSLAISLPANAQESNPQAVEYGISAKAADSTYLYTYVNTQLENGAGYVFGDTGFSINNAVDFVSYIRSGIAIDNDTKKAFVDSVYDNLSKNQGKLLTESGQEDLALYGACIIALQELGYDVNSFCGYDDMGEKYDIISSFETVAPNNISNPYYYRLAIEAADGEFAKALCNQFISDYYTLGKGMNYWGYSCDNTAVFLTAIAGCAKDYSEYVNDAISIIEKYTTDKGAYYSDVYTDENANSTAMALMAFSALGDCDAAVKYYNMLLNFQGETGIFTYYGNADLYATKDCVTALGYFRDLVYSNSLEHSEHIYTSTEVAPTCATAGKITRTCLICGKTVTEKILATKNHKYVGKVTKAPTAKATGVMTYTCSGCGYKFTREIPKLATTSITAVSSRSKSFGIRWTKQTNSTGYQIRYSTGSKMTNAKNVLVTKRTAVTKMITGLKANKKYYVQIRTYRVINGKRYYSDWSAVKSVTTKK